jgi:hypothetical protein
VGLPGCGRHLELFPWDDLPIGERSSILGDIRRAYWQLRNLRGGRFGQSNALRLTTASSNADELPCKLSSATSLQAMVRTTHSNETNLSRFYQGSRRFNHVANGSMALFKAECVRNKDLSLTTLLIDALIFSFPDAFLPWRNH